MTGPEAGAGRISARDTQCPYCGKTNDLHSGNGPTPTPGDVSICWGCTRPAFFTEDGVRAATSEEETELLADPDIAAAVEAAARHLTPGAALDALGWGR